MRIAGVYAKDGVVGGKRVRRGDPIELSHDRKIVESVKIAATTYSQEHLTYVTDVVLSGPAQSQPNGDPLKKKWENNSYTASGTCVLNRRSIAKDRILTPIKAKFKIRSSDSLDELGQPDLKVVECEFKKIP